jgi:malate dehydrogenase (oxaloacetate-decarboxylating)(NADP+)
MNKDSKRRELLYHAKPTPGKIQVVPTKKYATQRDLSWLILPLLSLVWKSLKI